jgi:hypothetical protein
MGLFDDVLADKKAAPAQKSGLFDDVLKKPAAKPSLFRMDSDFRGRSGAGVTDMVWAAAKDMFGSREGAAEYLAKEVGGAVEKDESGEPVIRLRDGTRYRLNDDGVDNADVAHVVGNVAAFALPAARVAKVMKARNAGLGTRALAHSSAAGATDVALQAGFGDGSIDPNRTGMAMAAGGLGEAAGTALTASGRAAANKVGPELRAIYEAAKKRGIDLTPAQLSDSRFLAYLRKQLGALPGSGAVARQAKQEEAFGRAVARTVGDTEPVTPEVYDRTMTRLGAEFDRFTKRDLPMSDTFMQRLLDIQEDAAAVADENAMRATKHFVNRIFKQGDGGRLPGQAVKSLDSELARVQGMGGEKAQYAAKLRDALHDELETVMPRADFDAWAQARQQYRNLMRITPLVARDGKVSPGKLMGAVTSRQADKRAMARGRGGELGELARIGQRMKAPPTSGTPEGVQSAAAAVGILNAPLQTLAGLTAGRAARAVSDSDLLAMLLMRQGRGQTRQALAPMLRPAGAATAPVMADPSEP